MSQNTKFTKKESKKSNLGRYIRLQIPQDHFLPLQLQYKPSIYQEMEWNNNIALDHTKLNSGGLTDYVTITMTALKGTLGANWQRIQEA